MSRFFKTTTDLQPNTTPAAEAAVVDLDQTITAVKQKVSKEIAAEVNRAVPATQPVRDPAREFTLERPDSPPIGASRSISVPHSNGTLLLASEDSPNPVAIESFERLRNKLLRYQSKSEKRSLVVCGADAGEGKTLVAANLALSWAQVHKVRVLLVDADLRSQGLTRLLGGIAAPGLADVLAGADYNAALVGTNVPHLGVVGAGTDFAPSAQLFASPRWKEFLEWGAFARVAECDNICGPSPGLIATRHGESLIHCCFLA